MISHRWMANGRFDDGSRRARCVLCGAHSRMDLAKAACPGDVMPIHVRSKSGKAGDRRAVRPAVASE